MTTTVPAVDATAHPLTTGGRAAAYWWSAGVLDSVLRSVLIVAVYVMLLMDEAPEWWIGLLIAAGFVVMTLLIHRLRKLTSLSQISQDQQKNKRYEERMGLAGRCCTKRLKARGPLSLPDVSGRAVSRGYRAP